VAAGAVVPAAAAAVVAAAPRPCQGEAQPPEAEEIISAGHDHLELNAESAVAWAIERRIVGKKIRNDQSVHGSAS
jgi:hypothetical protein